MEAAPDSAIARGLSGTCGGGGRLGLLATTGGVFIAAAVEGVELTIVGESVDVFSTDDKGRVTTEGFTPCNNNQHQHAIYV